MIYDDTRRYRHLSSEISQLAPLNRFESVSHPPSIHTWSFQMISRTIITVRVLPPSLSRDFTMNRVRTCQFSILTTSAGSAPPPTQLPAAGGSRLPSAAHGHRLISLSHSRLVDRVTPFRAVPDSLDSRRTGHHSGGRGGLLLNLGGIALKLYFAVSCVYFDVSYMSLNFCS